MKSLCNDVNMLWHLLGARTVEGGFRRFKGSQKPPPPLECKVIKVLHIADIIWVTAKVQSYGWMNYNFSQPTPHNMNIQHRNLLLSGFTFANKTFLSNKDSARKLIVLLLLLLSDIIIYETDIFLDNIEGSRVMFSRRQTRTVRAV